MLFLIPIRNLAVSIALALLAQVAYAQQAEFSFGLGKVPAEAAATPEAAANSTQLQFSQLPEFTAPSEGADELIGPVVLKESYPAKATKKPRTNRLPLVSRIVEPATVKPAATRSNAMKLPTSIVAKLKKAPLPRIEEKTVEQRSLQTAAFQQDFFQQEVVQQGPVQSGRFVQNAKQFGEASWITNPHMQSNVDTQGFPGTNASQAGSDFFAPHSASTIDRQTELSTTSQLMQTSAAAFAEPVVDPVDAPERLRLALSPPKVLGVKTTDPATRPGSIASIDPKALKPALADPATAEPAMAGPAAVEPKTAKTKPAKEPAKKTTKAAVKKAAVKKAAKKDGSDRPSVLQGNKNFKLAARPEQGAHFRDDTPLTDPRAHQIETLEDDFSPGPSYEGSSYFSQEQQNVYAGKKLYANQRPLVELGRPWYQLGQLSEGKNWFGNHNRITPQFLIYGDFRSAIASNNVGGDGTTLTASELNLDIDLKLTGTERFHAFVSPLDNGVQNSGYNFDDKEFVSQLDANIDFGYFEGDLGAMVGGFTGETLPFDMPFAIGVMPLLIQNGVWFEDAFLGVAATIPARNSARFNISNMDITFFAGYDKISSDAFPGDDGAARMYGVASFIEALNGYIEIDYAFLDDRSFDNRSYHNFAFAYSRRYGRLVSNSTRIIVNAGQASDVVENTADGVLLLSENSLITGAPSTLVPYFNFFAGFDRPQSAARAVQAGGVLRNTGILFESDGMTGYPTLDPTANDTYGAALGLNLLADDFSQQLMVEVAALGVMGEDNARNAAGEQIGVGFRYQLPLTNSKILRVDGMYGFLNDADDISGIRMELRQKW